MVQNPAEIKGKTLNHAQSRSITPDLSHQQESLGHHNIFTHHHILPIPPITACHVEVAAFGRQPKKFSIYFDSTKLDNEAQSNHLSPNSLC
jgi:hypothetical protein